MPPESGDPAYLWDMLDSARSIVQFVGQTAYADYLNNPMLQAAVERKIEIIGEAARKVSDPFKQSHPEIPWRKIIVQRNVLAHEYGEIEQESIWQVVKVHIPELIDKLKPLVPPPPT